MNVRHVLYWMAGSLLALGPAARAETDYFAVFFDGKKVGHATHSRQVAGGKVTTIEMMEMTMERMGVPLTVRQTETTVETAEGKPLSFASVQESAMMAMKVKGTVDKAGKVHVTITSGANTQQRTVDWPKGALMSEGMRLLGMSKGLKQGTTYSCKLFAPSMLSAVAATVVVGPTRSVDLLGRVATLTEVKATVGTPTGKITLTSYVDKEHNALKTIVPIVGMKVEMVACDRKLALSKPEAFEAFGKLTVASPVPLGDLGGAKSVTYHLAPLGKKVLSIPATDSQTVAKGEAGVTIVTVRPAKAGKAGTFPYKGADKAARQAMKPTRYVQSDDAKIIALARKAVGDAKDAGLAARRVEEFVRKYIDKKSLSVGYATAAEVAESRQGDCTEHAVLVAALCRAVGIPSRVVVGMLHVGRLGDAKDVFGAHAWAQAYLGGKWIDLDAAARGFDAGHIALAVGSGSPEDFFQIVTTLGQFRIADVKVEK